MTHETYHTPVFDNISEEKRSAVLDAASAEFADLGYTAANINVIARKAGVSIGSIYKYFTTKENLFLTVCARSVTVLAETLDEVMQHQGDFFEKVEYIIRIILTHSRKHSTMINLYNEITTEGNKELVKRLSYQMESVSARCYAVLIDDAKRAQIIADDLDAEVFAFHLDNLFMALQFSYASEYYKERMKVFINPDIHNDDERIISQTLKFLKKAFS